MITKMRTAMTPYHPMTDINSRQGTLPELSQGGDGVKVGVGFLSRAKILHCLQFGLGQEEEVVLPVISSPQSRGHL